MGSKMAQEIIADIIAEKRARADEIEGATGRDANQFQRELVADLRAEADRLEAAWKREKAKIEADALAAGGIVEAERHKPGNAAAMREALTKVSEWMAHRIATGGCEASPTFPTVLEDIVLPALAAPRRNCDVGSAEEWADRYIRFCDSHYKNHGNCFGCAALKFRGRCEFAWAQMPYEEGGAE